MENRLEQMEQHNSPKGTHFSIEDEEIDEMLGNKLKNDYKTNQKQ